jgi:inositol-1,3,4-trisphosphate 5/6-kinase/inositol-tetrakisphosphate 1-kinase
MALVLQPAALASLQGQLPLPALVQEFVNHGGTQFKVYVLGDKVRMPW